MLFKMQLRERAQMAELTWSNSSTIATFHLDLNNNAP